jgi:transcriptional regulator with XRE-family HTH domain
MDAGNVQAADLAKACRVSPSAVSQWLSGDTKPMTRSLQSAAAYLGVAIEDIVGRGPLPSRPRSAFASIAARREIADAAAMEPGEFAATYGYNPDAEELGQDLSADDSHEAECLEVVKEFAAAPPPVDLSGLARRLGVKVVYRDAERGFAGAIHKVGTGYVITLNGLDRRSRQRFTLAHELAHYIFHRSRIGDGIVDDGMYRSGLSDRLEQEANRWAADILMPPDEVAKAQDSGVHDLDELARRFGVSRSAMSIRLGVPTD